MFQINREEAKKVNKELSGGGESESRPDDKHGHTFFVSLGHFLLGFLDGSFNLSLNVFFSEMIIIKENIKRYLRK